MTETKFLTKELLQKLHKADLHCHLDGSGRASTLIELAKEQNVELPSMDEEGLKKIVVVPMDCPSLEVYLKSFFITNLVAQYDYALTRMVYELAEDAYKDGLTYIEVRFAPILHQDKGMSLTQVMEAVCDGVVLAQNAFPITMRIIVCGLRHLDSEVTSRLAEICWRYNRKFVCAFDLAGPESGFSSKHHRKAFSVVRKKLISVTIHAGEAFGWESIYDSIRYCGAQRLGHGVRLYENEELKEFVKDHKIALEMCPTSNIQTKAVKSLSDHPIRRYFDEGILTVPCTDNRTVSNINLTDEYFKIQEEFKFKPEEIVRMMDYSFSSAFLPLSIKSRLRIDALMNAFALLKKNKYPLDDFVKNRNYYDRIGVNVDWFLEKPVLYKPVFHKEPALTEEIIQQLPKTDIHCRLIGSVSKAQIWKEISKNPDLVKEFVKDTQDKEALFKILRPEIPKTFKLAKKIMKALLQTREQIERGIADIYKQAAKENVKYLELMIRPSEHLEKDLKLREIVEIAIATKKKMEEELNMWSGLILTVSTPDDDPLIFYDVAKLVVEFKGKGVNGFGCYGGDTTFENVKYYLGTFNYLKKNSINVSMLAGQKSANSIITALHEGGATRISGAFTVHKMPRLISHLSSHNIPIEIGQTFKLNLFSGDVKTYAGNPINLFFHSGLPITICSFRLTLDRKKRSHQLFDIFRDCKFTVPNFLKLLENGFLHNFQSLARRETMIKHYWKSCNEILIPLGFKNLRKYSYNPKLMKKLNKN
ncbi:adenosine deaminase [Anaeramoeba flamelloides]|uniref:adenosine deaminase n=1 Tax=Anaeramoeba flamelloides TaxID=1746091 RepID=A0AAV8AHT7_9EUKA|nr:adenosine deaminase [Anaeramoeba flamelloides]